jgi:hypothetical protein
MELIIQKGKVDALSSFATSTARPGRERTAALMLVVACALLAIGIHGYGSAHALDSFYCGQFGQTVGAGAKCPDTPERHSWTYNEAYSSVGDPPLGYLTTCQQAYRDLTGTLLTQSCYDGGTGYIDSNTGGASPLTGQFLSNAYVWNQHGAARLLYGYAHT